MRRFLPTPATKTAAAMAMLLILSIGTPEVHTQTSLATCNSDIICYPNIANCINKSNGLYYTNALGPVPLVGGVLSTLACLGRSHVSCLEVNDGETCYSFGLFSGGDAQYTCSENYVSCFNSEMACLSGLQPYTATVTPNSPFNIADICPSGSHFRCGPASSTNPCIEKGTATIATAVPPPNEYSCPSGKVACFNNEYQCTLNKDATTFDYGADADEFLEAAYWCGTQGKPIFTCEQNNNPAVKNPPECWNAESENVYVTGKSACEMDLGLYSAKNTLWQDGWMYIHDSPLDGSYSDGVGYDSEFELYGVAAKVSEDYVVFYINGHMPLQGAYYPDDIGEYLPDGTIGYADFLIQYDYTTKTFQQMVDDGTMMAVHLSPNIFQGIPIATDSGVTQAGLYTNVVPKSVTNVNLGYSSIESYESAILSSFGKRCPTCDSESGQPAYNLATTQNMSEEYGSYFPSTFYTGEDQIMTSINSGTKVTGDVYYVVSNLDVPLEGSYREIEELPYLIIGNHFNIPSTWYGEENWQFAIPRAHLPDGHLRMSLMTECANDIVIIDLVLSDACTSTLEVDCISADFFSAEVNEVSGLLNIYISVTGTTVQAPYELITVEYDDQQGNFHSVTTNIYSDGGNYFALLENLNHIPVSPLTFILKERPYCVPFTITYNEGSVTKTAEASTVKVGQIIEYTIQVAVPYGESSFNVVQDTISEGLQFVRLHEISIVSTSDITSSLGSWATVASNYVLSNGGRTMSFDFGTVTNSHNWGVPAIVEIHYFAQVMDSPDVKAGDVFSNNVVYGSKSSSVEVMVEEPELTLTVNAEKSTVLVCETVHYDFTLKNAEGSHKSPAFEVVCDVQYDSGFDELDFQVTSSYPFVNTVESFGRRVVFESIPLNNIDIVISATLFPDNQNTNGFASAPVATTCNYKSLVEEDNTQIRTYLVSRETETVEIKRPVIHTTTLTNVADGEIGSNRNLTVVVTVENPIGQSEENAYDIQCFVYIDPNFVIERVEHVSQVGTPDPTITVISSNTTVFYDFLYIPLGGVSEIFVHLTVAPWAVPGTYNVSQSGCTFYDQEESEFELPGCEPKQHYVDPILAYNFPGFAEVFGDPHFVGFNGVRYNFDGKTGEVFALLSDVEFQVNMELIEMEVNDVKGTWISKVGVITKNARVIVDPEFGALFNDFMLNQGGSYDLEEAHVDITVEGSRITKIYLLFEEAGYALNILPRHPKTRFGRAYLDIEFSLLKLPVDPHGVLGFTARHFSGDKHTSETVDPEVDISKIQPLEYVLDGSAADYLVKDGILGTSYTFSTFRSQVYSSVLISRAPTEKILTVSIFGMVSKF